ncbi:hypothetical protein FOZ60_015389 [Perkinsus olseni]|uniref:Uncharacterized protein n=1 Tax=Perkinsus olseni TaxID=32597 RepID=A0A7J6N5K6_PEROL|nr:hypothetical protein FOZ60_015389 [Perkinsus olseni]
MSPDTPEWHNMVENPLGLPGLSTAEHLRVVNHEELKAKLGVDPISLADRASYSHIYCPYCSTCNPSTSQASQGTASPRTALLSGPCGRLATTDDGSDLGQRLRELGQLTNLPISGK